MSQPQQGILPRLQTASRFVACNTIKFLYGYFFGSLIWFIIIQPYGRFFDLYQDRYWPEILFNTIAAMIFVLFIRARSVMVLFLPNLIGNASQNYVIVLLAISLFANPVSSIGNNAIESIRVIGCSLTMTFDQLKDRMDLILSPVIELLSDSNQTDLLQIEGELKRIQQVVSEIKQEASLDIGHEIAAVSSEARALTALKPPAVFEAIRRDIGMRLNDSEKSLTSDIAAKTRDLLRDSSVEFDSDKMALRASLDIEQLEKVIRSNISNPRGEVNLTDLMYENCLGIFRKAKSNCQAVVEEMRQSCRSTIGAFLAALFCSPITMTMDTICPWLLDQIINEDSLCSQMQHATSTLRLDTFNITGGADINAVYRNLSRQFDHLSDDLLNSQNSNALNNVSPSRRLEIDISFNNQTQNLFLKTQNLINFVREKFNLRQAFFELLLLLYEIYTTLTFFLVLLQAYRYDKNYLSQVRFDNNYITDKFVELDRDRGKAGKKTVLPLTRDESKRYIPTFACKRRTHEEHKTQRASCFSIIMFLAFVFAIAYFDDIFFSILYSVHSHALIHYKELGHHKLNFSVTGEGSIARIVRRLTSKLNSAYDLNKLTSTEPCLPNPTSTKVRFYFEFIFLIAVYLTIDQISIYAMRFRHLSASFFYPDQEKRRIHSLYNSILNHREKMKNIGLHSCIEEERELDDVDRDAYSLRDAVRYIGGCIGDSLQCCCQ